METDQKITNAKLKEFQEILKQKIATYHDWPKPNVNFKDLQSIIFDPFLAKDTLSHLTYLLPRSGLFFTFNKILCFDARGFIFGMPISLFTGMPMIMARKPDKLPGEVISQIFNKEYGTDTIEVQSGLIMPGDKVLIHDDLLGTGGTAEAAAKIILRCGAEVAGFNFVMEVDFLKGRDLLLKYTPNENINSVVVFD